MKVRYRLGVLIATLVATATISADPGQVKPQFSAETIHTHVAVLAHDSLEGRQVGEVGEWKAARYITEQFRAFGLIPAGDSLDADGARTYYQPFEFTKATQFGAENRLVVNDLSLKLHEEWRPLVQSASTEFTFDTVISVGYGITMDTADGDYDDFAGKDVSGRAVLIKRYSPSAEDYPDLDFSRYDYLASKISNAIEHQAAAVFMMTPTTDDDTMITAGSVRAMAKEIPIIYLRRTALERLALDLDDPELRTVAGRTELVKVRDTGYNVVGLLPGAGDTTIIMGAHYDHLGWGADNSRYQGAVPHIHNGADDNASGTAALLELARYYASDLNQRHHSLLFIAFSGEEAGILGSSYYAGNMTVDSAAVKMMINMDMIGRLKDQDGLVVFGTGSATEFASYFDSLEVEGLNVISKESGIGASDHTAFYSRQTPVLFFFTGAHEDYHMPTDDVDKIDADGIAQVCGLVSDIVDHYDLQPGLLTYQRTKSDSSQQRSGQRFSVTLGIMPDFIAEVDGLKVGAVTADKPADRAGILMGDVIVRMGAVTIGDIYDYMATLGKFRKGDTTSVLVVRELDTLLLPVAFE
ncbi:MAG: M28 family peptidase [bacterium]